MAAWATDREASPRRRRRQALAELRELADDGDVGLDEALRIEAVLAVAHHAAGVDQPARPPATSTTPARARSGRTRSGKP